MDRTTLESNLAIFCKIENKHTCDSGIPLLDIYRSSHLHKEPCTRRVVTVLIHRGKIDLMGGGWPTSKGTQINDVVVQWARIAVHAS